MSGSTASSLSTSSAGYEELAAERGRGAACDDIGPIFRDQVIKDAGAASSPTMGRGERALMIVWA